MQSYHSPQLVVQYVTSRQPKGSGYRHCGATLESDSFTYARVVSIGHEPSVESLRQVMIDHPRLTTPTFNSESLV
jgi:hypothetical protein